MRNELKRECLKKILPDFIKNGKVMKKVLPHNHLATTTNYRVTYGLVNAIDFTNKTLFYSIDEGKFIKLKYK